MSMHSRPPAADVALGVKIDAVGAKVDAIHVTLRDKIDSVHITLRDKIESAQTALQNKMDEGFRTSNANIDAVEAKLSEKLSKLSNDVAGMRGLQKAILWAIGGVGSLVTVAIMVSKALHFF